VSDQNRIVRDVRPVRAASCPMVNSSASVLMPPLLLDDEEAVAGAISLHTATTGSVAGLEETSLRGHGW
jgi:hypothetical protein